MAEGKNGVPQCYRDIAKLTGGCPEAIQERYIAQEALEQVGEVYYSRWLDTGEILPEALEDCMEAKARFDAAEALEAEYAKQKET